MVGKDQIAIIPDCLHRIRPIQRMAENRIEGFYKEVSADLTRTMQFWIKHSHDEKYG